MVRKLLKFFLIIQEVSNNGREKKLGRGFFKARRFNPYNPLSYIAVIIFLIVGILMFGFVGIWKEVDVSNPFKWN
jgi:predicted PurR-regulated permease PerM